MKVQIKQESAEWRKLNYTIQQSVGKSSIKLISLLRLSDEDVSGHDAIVNLTDFGRQYAEKLLKKTLPLEDVIFYCGHVNIHQYSNQPYKVFTFIVCKVNLGVITASKSNVGKSDAILIPQQDQQALQFNFFVRTHNQYTPLYQATFTISDDKDFKLSQYQCCNCQNRVPTVYCKAQNLFFCDDCCGEHHKSKLMQSHQLQNIDKVNTLGLCKNHSYKLVYFCLKCQKYLCQMCTQKGVHHQNHEHPIKLISYYYQQAKQNIQSLPKKHKQKLQAYLFNLQVKKRQVDGNYTDIKAQITKIYQQSLKQLENLYNQKLISLNSCQIELKMIHDKIQWKTAFAKFQERTLKPLYFFQSQLQFEEELSKVKIADFQPIFKIKPDLMAIAQIKVGTKEILQKSRKKQKQGSQNMIFTSDKNTNKKSNDNKDHSSYLQEESILSYNKNSVMPRKGQLSLILESSHLNFFRISS